MNGRPVPAQADVRIVRGAQPGATHGHALPLTVTIVVISVFVAALFTRPTGPVAALIGPWDPPVALTENRGPADGGSPPSLDGLSPGSAGVSLTGEGPSSTPPATSVAPVPPSSLAATTPKLPACRSADEPAAHAAYDDWQRTIVDTTSRLPRGYVPPDLVAVSRAGLSGGGTIRLIAIADLKALAKAGRKAGVRLAVESAYRSEAQQQRTFASWVRTSGEAEARRFSARAGHSEHQLGTAIDFKAAGRGSPWAQAFAHSRLARWLAANAWRFGWTQSYPPGAQMQTCYGGEPWHYRYVGRVVAEDGFLAVIPLPEPDAAPAPQVAPRRLRQHQSSTARFLDAQKTKRARSGLVPSKSASRSVPCHFLCSRAANSYAR
jgi:D-alanyl-D-alanine carboxypeptidase